MTPGDLPHIYDDTRELKVKLSGEVSAKLATLRRELHPTYTDEQVAAWLIRDALVHCGLLDLPAKDRGKAAGTR